MIYITAVSVRAPGTHAKHITTVWWLNGTRGSSNTLSVPDMVSFIREGNQVQVGGPDGPVNVEVVDADPPYLRTVADQTSRDNLLQLPRF
jgi:Protein of unknown function (DUF3892)